jgi:hypothetical protein
MKNKATFIDTTNCDIFWFDVELFGAWYEGKYQAMMIRNADKEHWSAKDYFNLYVWAGTSKQAFITTRDIIDRVYEAIFEQQKEIREGK